MAEPLVDLNYTLNMWEQVFQNDVLASYPVDVGVPAGDRCNIRCIFCTDREKTRPTDYKNISFEEFLKFSVPLTFASSIQIQGWGEPFINPDYKKIFTYVSNRFRDALIKLNTNGVLLDNDWVDLLTSTGDRICINISLNAATPETYRQITKKDYFARVINNISNLVQKRKEKGTTGSHISVSIVGTKTNIHELPELIDLASELGVDCLVLRELMILRPEHEKESLNHYPDITAHALKAAFERSREWKMPIDVSTFPVKRFLPEFPDTAIIPYGIDMYAGTSDHQLPVIELPGSLINCGACYEPWSSFIIDNLGDVRICCYSQEVMGNVFDQSFQEIWNGEPYRYFRMLVNTENPPGDCCRCIKKQ